ncbi:MAG: lipoyl(octanoyl) transferase LipB [Myxococcota bacterium]
MLVESSSLRVTHLGKSIPHAEGMRVMRACMDDVGRDRRGTGHLLLLEHDATVTITRSGGTAHLRVPPEDLLDEGIDLVETDRGGDVTFHGPGQIVGYPVVALHRGDDGRVDLLGYLRALEGALVAACERLGVRGCHRREGMTGVWVASRPDLPVEEWPKDHAAKKLVAIGVGVKCGVTRHGFALNVDIDLPRFTSRIVPCGLLGRGVTRLIDEVAALPPEGALLDIISSELCSALSVPRNHVSQSLSSGERLPDGALYG